MEQERKILPFFPLSVFLLPGEDIPLRIFEPRYKQLIEEAREAGITFVIPYIIESEIQNFGCEVKLKEVVAENPAGRMVINVECIALVKIESYNKQLGTKLYSGGEISYLPDPPDITNSELRHIILNYTEHFDHDFLNCCEESSVTDYDLLRALNLPSDEKYNFIRLDSDFKKENYLITQMRFLMMIRNQEQLLGNDFGLN
jgi:hypothetical protein